MTQLPRVSVYSLGGTIAMSGDTGQGANLALNADDLVKQIPSLDQYASVKSQAFLSKTSSNISFDDLIKLAAKIRSDFLDGSDGVVVIQGTDAMEETAFVLDLLLGDLGPVAVTGAMRTSEAVSAEGPANIFAAIIAVSSPQLKAANAGVVLVANDDVHAARFVTKSHTAKTSTFTSPECGPIGLVSEGQLYLYTVPANRPHFDFAHIESVPDVALVVSAFDDDGRMLNYVKDAGYKAAVLEAFGAGHLSHAVSDLAEQLARDMIVMVASRTGAGPTFTKTYGYKGAEVDLANRGLLLAGALGARKARILLALLLANRSTFNEVEAAFLKFKI